MTRRPHTLAAPDEIRFLLSVLRAFIKGFQPPAVPPGLAWQALETVAARNRLMPIVVHALGVEALPDDIAARWQALMIGVDLHYARALQASRRLASALEQERIPFAFLRGMALADWIYPSPVLRPMVDVDVLIPSTCWRELPARLERRGIAPVRRLRSQWVCGINGVAFELHWSLLTPRRYARACRWTDWLNTRQPAASGLPLYRLSASYELLELICHSFVHHQLRSGLQVVDLALLCERESVDWETVLRWSQSTNMSRMVWFTLQLVNRLFNLGLENRWPAVDLPSAHEQGIFRAYEAALFGSDTPMHRLRRRLHLLDVAETPERKVRQLLCFLSSPFRIRRREEACAYERSSIRP